MAEFKRVNPDCSFSLPDVITVRQQLAFFSQATYYNTKDLYERVWEAGKPLIENWICPALPNPLDPEFDFDKVTDPDIAQVIVWAGQNIRLHLNGLKSVPKN